ncbi:MAG: hypothetical protein MI807_13235 [Verrucomicrobiales bacterium]|nr:hypothetical protein [Verrucomicrobiales bacterium]
MAQRYDQKTKDEVVAFIQSFNEENGRGGQSAAAKKYKLNPITVRAWMEKAGVATPGKSSRKKKKGGRKTAASNSIRRSAAPKSTSAALKRMVKLQEQIEDLQSEYESLKASL